MKGNEKKKEGQRRILVSRFMRKTKPQRRWKPCGEQGWNEDCESIRTSYEAVLSLKESESADAPEIKITTPLANTEVAEGGVS